MSKVLITGITGQDGSYLAELLLSQGHTVTGMTRRHSNFDCQSARIAHIQNDLTLVYGDMTDANSLSSVIDQTEPDVIYNLAAQSDVKISFLNPAVTTAVNATGVLNLLETVRIIDPKIKIYQASSSEMFGNSVDTDGFQRETTIMNPVSPYGCAKLFAYNLTRSYRQSYNMHIVNGILFNHESPRRGTNFVTNKIIKEAVKIYRGQSKQLPLGNLEAFRDWGHAKDYVYAMTLMMGIATPNDYVCASGISHSIRDMVSYVFGRLNLDYQEYVIQDPAYYRAIDIGHLRGDCSYLKEITGWKPSYNYYTMIDEMIDYWMKQI